MRRKSGCSNMAAQVASAPRDCPCIFLFIRLPRAPCSLLMEGPIYHPSQQTTHLNTASAPTRRVFSLDFMPCTSLDILNLR